MTDGVATLGHFPADDRGRVSRKTLPFIVLGVAAFAFGTAMGVWNSASDDAAVDEAAIESTDTAPATTASFGESRIAKSFGALAPRANTVAKTIARPAAAKYPYVALFFDPGFARGSAVAFSQTAPVTPDYPLSPKTTMARNQKVRVPNVDISLASIPEPDTLLPLPAQPAPQLALSVPMPRSRPADMRLPASDGPSRQDVAKEIAQLNNKTSVVATLSPDKRTLLQKLFGQPETGPVLAYAGPDGGILSNGDSATPGKLPSLDQQTAVYDISARTVYMPDGSKLEAHSGLGSLLDDPQHVHVRMRGATPPALYDLTMRERLFHGVQALRLSPVGSDVFGRTGLLAHTYMLGPNGDSNGCVSFKNYETFLRAYQNGKVKRLAVVARLS
ncbi:DUF2778 domain-containing protein [Bradyrhizobium prioriisuperbiae]|uniref:DUF2778 domain-containing protein n=1 Tax=Bradyrhizobium prioriisuperbiae TaxID=2854389 RepID=UPI0028E3506A|nr:DUF2778 domain-containing protein [Bradyrhizobium prioritasuperba]